MVASLINTDTTVAVVSKGEKHIIDLNHLPDKDLKELKRAAIQNLLEINTIRDQVYEFIRRVNGVLDDRINSASCLYNTVSPSPKG